MNSNILYRIIKRTFDIITSIIGLVFLIPIALLVKISYILTGDFNSIFFIQKRIGKNGKEFNLFKFRTMIPNADEELKKMLGKDKILKEEYSKNKKLRHDPRITTAGRIIRRYSIDEIPYNAALIPRLLLQAVSILLIIAVPFFALVFV